jgi:hypothetical protein
MTSGIEVPAEIERTFTPRARPPIGAVESQQSMKAALLVILALSIPVTLSARTHKIKLDIHSNPEGAQVMQGEAWTPIGVTPLTLTYEIADACGPTQQIALRWASGATASTIPQLCTSTGKQQYVTFERPVGISGLDVDLQVASQQTQTAYQQAMLTQMNRLNREVNYAAFLQSLQANPPLQRTSALCVTRAVARGVSSVW